MRLMIVMLVGAALLGPELGLAQTAADSAAIRATALDYIEGWYEGNADRMERALHPHLAKREVLQDRPSGSRLVEVSALDLIQSTRRGVGKVERARRRTDVRILDVFGNAAMVKIDATDWVDYLQEIKWNGRWVIINVVWENRPRQLEGLEPLVDSVMTQGMAAEHIPGAAFVFVHGGKVVLEKGYGFADLETRRNIDPRTSIFPIASISKLFTATALMQLVDRGRIGLYTDVNQYLRSVKVPASYPHAITPWHLLTHTAGLDELPGRQVASPAELRPLGEFLATRLVRVRPPGEITSYSSYGMTLAGVLVEDASGLAFEAYLSRNIWRPLGMHRTYIHVPDSLAGDVPAGYAYENGATERVPGEIYQTTPASSIMSTARDVARFMMAHLQNGRLDGERILSDSAARAMHQQQVTVHPLIPGWGLGFQISDANGRRICEHGGGIGGFSSLLVLLPDENAGFFVVHHREGADLRFDLRKAILDRYFPDRRLVRKPVPNRRAARHLQEFAGTYRGNIYCHSCQDPPGMQDFQFTANDDGTITIWGRKYAEVSPLYFVSLDGRGSVGFKRDAEGRVVASSGGSWRVVEKIR
jgi:CubicO group peptidase (beta-lactamase class C family)